MKKGASLLFYILFLWVMAGCTSFESPPDSCANGLCADRTFDSFNNMDHGKDETTVDIGKDTGPGDEDVSTGDIHVDTEADTWDTMDVPPQRDRLVDQDEGRGIELDEIGKDTDTKQPDSGHVGLGFGMSCVDDQECITGHCVNMNAEKRCTRECSDKKTCPAGYECLPYSRDETGYVYMCMAWPENLCRPCIDNRDCPDDMVCYANDYESFCTRLCDEDGCPAGFSCQGVDEFQAQLCMPNAGTCECGEDFLGAKTLCEVTNNAGTCTGTATCEETGWSVCTALIPQQETCDGVDNNCNGKTDEDFTITDWDGQEKGIGEPCGTGVCASKVECRDEKTAWCPGMANALDKELCGDQLDNNCNGKTDEGCENADPDGDGYSDDDCKPYDAAMHPGAKEPCCPVSVPEDQRLDRCDYNCDGKVTMCADTDKDGDGYSPPDDCNDDDPNIHPGAAEKCGDGIDQDCDGSDVPCDDVRDNDGDHYFPPFDCNDDDPDVHPGAPEKCNYIDDDCDGLTDEGNPEGGKTCGTNVGECHTGVMVCSHYPFGVKVECMGSKGPTAEKCNGLDDNCDGKTDEDWPELGTACDGDDFDLCKNGTFTCKPDGSGTECVNEKVTDILEVCGNKIDDNCNGQTDEGCFPDDIDGDGYPADKDCNDFRAEIHPGAKEPCCPPDVPEDQRIAQCDYNCDGTVVVCADTDKDHDGFSPPDDCDDNDPHVFPGAPEKCGDGIDQDCDGMDMPCSQVTDRDGDGYYLPEDCNDSNPDIHPWAQEKCDYIDDDCDGIKDNGNPGGGDGPCGLDVGECKPGITVCIHYPLVAKVECVPKQQRQPELCDGLDNDCDGKTDENWPKLGQACDGPDSDQCEYGTMICSEDHTKSVCSKELVENIQELCDGIDNDCDGQTDEGFEYQGLPLGSECSGIGECGKGIVECSPDKQGATCSTNPDGSASQAQKEVCDGKDNDCDGETDEDQEYRGEQVNLGDSCEGLGECGEGVIVCSNEGSFATCSTNPDGTTPQAQEEVCDGKDNDCDGITDNNLDPGRSPCKTMGVCKDQDIAHCVDGQWECDYSHVPNYEGDSETSCDGLDNDCDGHTDEDFIFTDWNQKNKGVGANCGTGECGQGVVQCTPDHKGVMCSTDVKKQAELCDGKDNDCDGKTDEDFVLTDWDGSQKALGEPCGTGLCSGGTVKCNGKQDVACSTASKAESEKCNHLDDDCDGKTDENFTIVDWDGTKKAIGESCGTGLCTGGTVQCKTENSAACSTANKATTETCNNVDDDCNGKTDDNLQENISSCLHDGVCANNVHADCEKGQWVCDYSQVQGYEQGDETLCDGKDNNCNGQTDETWPDLGQPCDGPDSDQCKNGVYKCAPDNGVECVETVTNIKEQCWDGIDNDCDGLTDEEGASGCKNFYFDGDHDGYGTKDKPRKCLCNKGDVKDYTSLYPTDCDDSNPDIHPGAKEIPGDGIDNNCDGVTE